MTLNDLTEVFLEQKQALTQSGELSPRTYLDYCLICQSVQNQFGGSKTLDSFTPKDFATYRSALARQYGPYRLALSIQQTRTLFKFAFDSELITTPIRYGPSFAPPTKKVIRLHKAKQGPKLFTQNEIKQLAEIATVPMRAMILLGINCGYGNADCGSLPITALALERCWVTFPRPKTGVARRCALWPQTVAALREALATRPKPKREEHENLVFITKYGASWHKQTTDSPISKEMRILLNSLSINGHRNFYTLRHTFRTVADESHDQPSIDHIMGHESGHISTTYRERISDERLKAVSNTVYNWLFQHNEAQHDGNRSVPTDRTRSMETTV